MSRNPRVTLTKCWYCWQCPVALVLEMASHSNHRWETMDILGGPKKVCKSQNLRDLCSVCFLRFGDKNQFPGPGLWHCWGYLCKQFLAMVDQIAKTFLTDCTIGTGGGIPYSNRPLCKTLIKHIMNNCRRTSTCHRSRLLLCLSRWLLLVCRLCCPCVVVWWCSWWW